MSEPEKREASYDTVVADLKARKEREIQEIAQKYDNAIAAIEAVRGGLAIQVNSSDATGQGDSADQITIAIGEFHGMPYTNAARVILQKTGRKVLTTREILNFIEKSGRKVEVKNPAGTIYSSLTKNADFELVAPNTWGLAEWYGKKRKSNKSVATRTLEIMETTAIPFSKAAELAKKEKETA